MLSTLIGKQKENEISLWLKKQGIKLLTKNFHCKGGEIDIIALEPITKNLIKAHNRLLFIEVKYRKNSIHGEAKEWVNKKKQRHIIQCAQVFLQKKPKYNNYPMRFDVITQTAKETPIWLKDAFQNF